MTLEQFYGRSTRDPGSLWLKGMFHVKHPLPDPAQASQRASGRLFRELRIPHPKEGAFGGHAHATRKAFGAFRTLPEQLVPKGVPPQVQALEPEARQGGLRPTGISIIDR